MDTSTTQAIAASIAAAIAAVISAGVSAYFGFKIIRKDKHTQELQVRVDAITKELRRCHRQIASYHELEAIACARIAEVTNAKAQTVQKQP